MKSVNRKLKLGITFIHAILLVVLLFCGITLAILTATQSITNHIVLGNTKISVEEKDGEGNSVDPENVKWGAENKQVCIAAESNVSVYVRAAIVLSVKDAAGNALPFNFGELSAPGADNKLAAGDFTLHFEPGWENNWFFSDGYYYYKQPIIGNGSNGTDKTTLLLRGITLTDETEENIKKYEGLAVSITVIADSVQAANGYVLNWDVSLDSDGTTLIPKT